MKRTLLSCLICLLAFSAVAQQKSYWVFFTDKNDTQFDPYTYFDAKAIARYEQCGADLYDISNYPLNDSYVNTVEGYSIELFGTSRWLNAVGVTATEPNALRIEQLPFVERIQEMGSEGLLARVETFDKQPLGDDGTAANEGVLSDQLIRFGGQHFIDHGINGKGLRICVMDGGFPKVDTHPAFKHLRDNHQILKTYNFPNKKEDVYGWSTHGTMVLSCIAGIDDKGQQLGLATGAEFLLARTEIDPEPFKEEIWWAQGAEWADKNGADIINSSLGYGKDRHWTKDMDGTSYVAKAANKAVEKGILICNSAGNEGDDSRWMTIITPSDAENVLCVGGITNNLDFYHHISFSSYGPTADKRRKPDVCAYGTARVANPSGGFTSASGTSFSSPLTAGFCACAWQTKRDLTALQMKEEIQKSADLYPYFDYAYGYGVPQAAYFTGEITTPERTFEFVEGKDDLKIHFNGQPKGHEAFVNVEGADGVLLGYYKLDIPKEDTISLKKADLGAGTRLNVSYGGFFDSYPLSGNGIAFQPMTENTPHVNDAQNTTFPKIKQEAWQKTTYFQYDYLLPNDVWNGFNRHFAYGKRYLYGKTYKVGFGWNIGMNRFVAKNSLGINNRVTQMRQFQLGGELMQRVMIRLWGVNWDLGGYGSVNLTRRVKTIDELQFAEPDPSYNYSPEITSLYKRCTAMNRFEYGATTRLSYSIQNMINIGVYARYRLSDIITQPDFLIGDPAHQPSPWSVGIEFEIVP